MVIRQESSALHVVNEIKHIQIPPTPPGHLSDISMSSPLLRAESIQMSLKPALTVQGQLFNRAGHKGKGSFQTLPGKQLKQRQLAGDISTCVERCTE